MHGCHVLYLCVDVHVRAGCMAVTIYVCVSTYKCVNDAWTYMCDKDDGRHLLYLYVGVHVCER